MVGNCGVLDRASLKIDSLLDQVDDVVEHRTVSSGVPISIRRGLVCIGICFGYQSHSGSRCSLINSGEDDKVRASSSKKLPYGASTLFGHTLGIKSVHAINYKLREILWRIVKRALKYYFHNLTYLKSSQVLRTESRSLFQQDQLIYGRVPNRLE